MENIQNEQTDLTPRQRIALFQELVTCGTPVCSWMYSENLHLLQSSNQDPVLNTIFEHTGCLNYMKQHFDESSRPLVLSTYMGMMWCAACENPEPGSEMTRRFHVIGPALNTDLSDASLKEACRSYRIPAYWHDEFTQLMRSLPVISASLFFQVAVMLHYCAAGEKLSVSDISFQQSEQFDENHPEGRSVSERQKDRSDTYHTEQAILRNVREGNLDYSRSLEQAGRISYGVRIYTRDPIDQAIISASGFVTLCTRAAIEGGMSPDAAYSLGDSYIQSLAGCRHITDIRSINHTMYDDFVQRVHRLRTETKYSKQIQSCTEYIDMHPEEELSLKYLADRAGYAEYYLSGKFRQETGSSVKEYIKKARIRRAKEMLEDTMLSISEIAEKLHFCSGSYFSGTFKNATGMLPQEYRNKYQHL